METINKILNYLKNSNPNLIAIIFIIILSIAPYINSIKNPFIWDDEEIVVSNELILDFKNLPKMFKSDVFGSPIKSGGFYRPLQTFSYSIDYKIFGMNPSGFRAINITIHSLNALLVFLLLKKLKIKMLFAFAISAIFAVHPVNIESVSYISGRGDAMFLFFSLLSFILYIKGSEKKICYLPSALFFCGAIFSKESAIVLPFVMLAHSVLVSKNKNIKTKILFPCFMILISCAYAYARFSGGGIKGSSALSIISDASIYERISTAPRIVINYIYLLVFPNNLHMEYIFLEKSVFNPYFILGTPFILSLSYLAILKSKSKRKAIFFLAWFFVGLGPFYNIILPLSSSLREHWIYFSEIGFFAIVAIALEKLWRKNKKTKIALSAIFFVFITFLSVTTILRNKVWASPIKLYENDLALEPNSFLLHNNLGVEYFRAKDFVNAKKSFENSINSSPRKSYDIAHNNLGAVYEKFGDINKAIENYEKSVEYGDYELAYQNLGGAYIKKQEYEKASQILEKGLSLYQDNIQIQFDLGVCYFYLNDKEKAKNLFLQIKKIIPQCNECEFYLGLIEKNKDPRF